MVGDSILKVRFPSLFWVSSFPLLSIHDTWDSNSSSWRLEVRRMLKDDEIDDYIALLSGLNPIILREENDQLRWSLDSSGVFQVALYADL